MRGASALHWLAGFILCGLLGSIAHSADRVRMVVAGTERSANGSVARDVAKFIARPAEIDFDIRYVLGPTDALARLRESNVLQFAIVQSDIATSYLAAAGRGNVDAAQLMAPLRVIAPLHEETIHFLVHGDSPLNFVHEIEHAQINLGPLSSATALTGATIYRLMFGNAIPNSQTSFYSHQDALVKLTEKSVDVVMLLSAQPARLLADMKPEAKRYVKLLKVDPNHSATVSALKTYSMIHVSAGNYPNLLSDDLSALAVRIYLVSHGRNDSLQGRFAEAWCQNLPRLQSEQPSFFGKIDATFPSLSMGWQYSGLFEREQRACMEGKPAPVAPCSQEDRILGLCGK